MSHRNEIHIKEADIKKELMEEAIGRIRNIRHAQLYKQSMAFGVGYSGLNVATNNLDWIFPDIGSKIQAIRNEIESKFSEYLKTDLESPHRISDAFVIGPVDSNDPSKVSGEEGAFGDSNKMASLVMRFFYRRRILPHHDPVAMNRATSAISNLNNFLSQLGLDEYKIEDFIKALEKNRVPLSPYFHVSKFSANRGGGITQEMLKDFIQQERVKYMRYPSLPGGINPSNFFADHIQRIASNARVALTETKAYNRKFKNAHIDDVTYSSYLVKAIANKVKQGYALNISKLRSEVQKEKDRYVQHLNLEDTSAIDEHYNNILNRIYKEFNLGLQIIRFTREHNKVPRHMSLYHWGVIPGVGYRQGLQRSDNGRSSRTNLTLTELKILLRSLSGEMWDYLLQISNQIVQKYGIDAFKEYYNQNFASTFIDRYLGPDEFYVPGYSMTYSSNGLDTDPTDPNKQMLLMPGLKKLPSTQQGLGKIVYDTDNCNLGRHHLVKCWFNSFGGGLNAIVLQFGPWAEKVLQAIQQRSDLLESKGISKIACNVILNSRSNAETLIEMMQQYPTWEDFLQKQLLSSLASQLSTYYQYLPKLDDNDPVISLIKTGVIDDEALARSLVSLGLPANHPAMQILSKHGTNGLYDRISELCRNNLSNPLKDTIVHYQQTGDWDAFVSQIQQLGLVAQKTTDESTRINREGFELLKRYGYPIAKLMDLISCIMYASSAEILTSRQSRKGMVKEIICGRKYSTSSGKGDGGQVMIGVRYGFHPPEMIDQSTPHGHQTTQEPMSELQEGYHSGQKTVVKITENLEYFIGEAGSSEGMLRDLVHGTDWPTMLDEFLRRFPTLESQLGILISPVKTRFDLIELSVKKALDNVRSKLEKELSQRLEIVFRSQNGEEELLNSDRLKEEMDILQHELSITEDNITISDDNVGDQLSEFDQAEELNTGITPNENIQYFQQLSYQPTDSLENKEQQPINNMQANQTEEHDDEQSKPMIQQYPRITKKHKGKQLIKNQPQGILPKAFVLDKLDKVATKLDHIGLYDLASKLDYILDRISKL